MKQDTKMWVAIGALVAIALVVKDKDTGNAIAGVRDFYDDDDDFSLPSDSFVPRPTAVFTPAPADVIAAYDDFEGDDFSSPTDFWTSIDVVELGVEAGKSVTRTVAGTIDPLAAITGIIPGVPTFGPLYTPVNAVLDLF